MRRRTDISGSRMNESSGILAKPNAMGLLLSSGTISISTGSAGDAATRTRRQGAASHPHQTMPLSTRTLIDSPGLITSVGYVLISGRSAAVFGSNLWCVSSYPGGPVSLRSTHPPTHREIEWEGECAISTGRCSVLRIGPSRAKAPSGGPHEWSRYSHALDGAPRIGVDHTAAKFDRDRRIWIRTAAAEAERGGGGQLSAVASNAGDDARTNRDEAKMSQHIPLRCSARGADGARATVTNFCRYFDEEETREMSANLLTPIVPT